VKRGTVAGPFGDKPRSPLPSCRVIGRQAASERVRVRGRIRRRGASKPSAFCATDPSPGSLALATLSRKGRGVRRWHRMLLVLGLLGVSACNQRSETSFTPPATNAKRAVETALASWVESKPMEKFVLDGKAVHPIDHRWKEGKKLTSFEIVGNASPAPTNATHVTVKLQLDGEKEPTESNYRVFGIDPLWVYLEEDFDKTFKGM
jgi:hypothetical protein